MMELLLSHVLAPKRTTPAAGADGDCGLGCAPCFGLVFAGVVLPRSADPAALERAMPRCLGSARRAHRRGDGLGVHGAVPSSPTTQARSRGTGSSCGKRASLRSESTR